MSARIRAFEHRDRPLLEQLMDRFQDEIVAMDPHGRLLRRRGYGRRWVELLLDDVDENDGLLVVADDDGEVVGFAGGAVRLPDPDDLLGVVDFRKGEVTELYVVPSRRGQGVGRDLLQACETAFRERGCESMQIEVFAPNADARRFYDRMRYEERDLVLMKLLD